MPKDATDNESTKVVTKATKDETRRVKRTKKRMWGSTLLEKIQRGAAAVRKSEEMAMEYKQQKPLPGKSEYKAPTEIGVSFENQGYEQFDTCSCLSVDSVIEDEEEERIQSREQK